MPRPKKFEEPASKRKGKKIVEEEDDIIEEEVNSPKKTRKAAPKPKARKGKKVESEEEDDLSELDVEDEEAPAESGENDEVVSNNAQVRQPRKVIDPKTSIGKLKPDEILNYLIQLGADTLNPQLKFGSINLLNQLTGRRGRPPPYGSNRGNFGQRGGGGGGGSYTQYGRGRPMQQQQQQQQPSMRGPRTQQNNQNNDADVYGDAE